MCGFLCFHKRALVLEEHGPQERDYAPGAMIAVICAAVKVAVFDARARLCTGHNGLR
jgi:hypothetical protein